MKEYKNGAVKFDLEELNDLAIYAGEAMRMYEMSGCPRLAEKASKFRDMLHNIGEKHGLYANLPDLS